MRRSIHAASATRMRRIFVPISCAASLPARKIIRRKAIFCLSNQELDEYRVAHTSKTLKYPYAPKPDPEA